MRRIGMGAGMGLCTGVRHGWWALAEGGQSQACSPPRPPPPRLPLRQEVMASGGRHSGLSRHRHVYMRWKEQFFVEGCECRLTIAGFYYLCLDRCVM